MEEQKLPHVPTPPFYFAWHPARWQCVGGRWLPLLKTVRLDLGVGGVDKEGDHTLARLDDEKRGWHWLPWDIDGDPYIREWPCVGGSYHCTRWETPRQVGGMPVQPTVDEKGWHEFLARLVDRGIVPLPDQSVADLLVDNQRHRVEHVAAESHKPGVLPILEREQARLAEMRAAK